MKFLKGHWNLVINGNLSTTTKFECEENNLGTIKCTYLKKSNVNGVIKWDLIKIFASDI